MVSAKPTPGAGLRHQRDHRRHVVAWPFRAVTDHGLVAAAEILGRAAGVAEEQHVHDAALARCGRGPRRTRCCNRDSRPRSPACARDSRCAGTRCRRRDGSFPIPTWRGPVRRFECRAARTRAAARSALLPGCGRSAAPISDQDSNGPLPTQDRHGQCRTATGEQGMNVRPLVTDAVRMTGTVWRRDRDWHPVCLLCRANCRTA